MTSDPMPDLAATWGVQVQEVSRPDRGANNLVWFLNGDFVLRVYQNLTEAQVEAEHRLLAGLQEINLPFAVPAPIPTPSGATWMATPDGPAALYPMLPGRPARDGDLDELGLLGSALGDLMVGL